jgi:hypothetical protein
MIGDAASLPLPEEALAELDPDSWLLLVCSLFKMCLVM